MDPTDSDIFVETQQKRIDELRATLEATERERDALRAIHTQVQDVLDTTGLPAPDIVSGVKELRNRYGKQPHG